MSAVAIRRRGPEDADDLFRLYRDVFGEELTASSKGRWRWQYLENPANGPEGPEIWVASDERGPLGQYASMPVRLWWGGLELRSSWGMDVFVRAEARGRGIGEKLFRYWGDQVDVALGLGLTASSHSLFKKLRYRDVGPVPFFQKVLDPGAVAQRRVGPALATVAGPLLALGLRTMAPERSHPGSGEVAVRRITAFSPDCDRLWERARGSYAMCVRRDAAYLNWKFQRCPNRRYALWEGWRGAELAGFAVSRVAEHRGLRLGWLLDVFAPAGESAARDALIAAVLEDFRRGGVARAQAFAMSGVLGADLERRGFRRARSPMQFCVRATAAADRPFSALDDWHVVFGDSDMDR